MVDGGKSSDILDRATASGISENVTRFKVAWQNKTSRVVAANFIPLTMVAPLKWKRALGVPADKDGARARASQLLPAHAGLWCRVKDDGRAEAALIAYYGVTVLGG